MGKTVEDICNLLTLNNELCFEYRKQVKRVTLYDSITETIQNVTTTNPFLTDCFSDIKMYRIAQKLATAVDKNNIDEIKELKALYGDSKDFAKAKKLLNDKCKEVWSVYLPSNAPKEAMKALGITNQPDLDFILGNSIRHFEKDDGDTTSFIIAKTLNNKNMNYTIEDIHEYLVRMNKKEKCNYNFKTVSYLISQHNYDDIKLKELGIDDITIAKALETLKIGKRAKYYINNIKNTKLFEKAVSLF